MEKKTLLSGVMMMCGACMVACFMSTLVKLLSGVSSYQIVLYRFIIGLGILSGAALFGKIRLTFTRSRLLFIRGVIGGFAIFIFFLSISKLGVGKGTVFIYSYPIFVSILSVIFLREKITILKWVFIFLALSGIYILVSGKGIENEGMQYIGIYRFIAILGAILTGTAVVLIKKLHDSDSSYSIFFAQCLVGFWLFLFPANLNASSVSVLNAILLLLVGISATTAQLLMTEAYCYVPATTGSLLNLLVPVLNVFVAILIFDEPFLIREFIGSALVVLSCGVVIISDKTFS